MILDISNSEFFSISRNKSEYLSGIALKGHNMYSPGQLPGVKIISRIETLKGFNNDELPGK
jgi:hypothetical protein